MGLVNSARLFDHIQKSLKTQTPTHMTTKLNRITVLYQNAEAFPLPFGLSKTVQYNLF